MYYSQGAITGLVCGFAVHMMMGVGNFLSNPWPISLNSTIINCPDNLTVSDDILYGKYVSMVFGASYVYMYDDNIYFFLIFNLLITVLQFITVNTRIS